MIITVQGSSGPLPSHSRPSETRNKKLEESLFVTKRFIKQEDRMTVSLVRARLSHVMTVKNYF